LAAATTHDAQCAVHVAHCAAHVADVGFRFARVRFVLRSPDNKFTMQEFASS
jgi:hypothetical protein